MIPRSNKGLTGIEVVLIVAALGALGWFAAPKIFHGASRRADNSAKATAQLEQATNAQGSSAAASVAMIGTAAGMATSSPAVDFIRREVPVALAKLPAPDPTALIQAEQRRVAVMEGKLDEARRLYEQESKRAARLQEERDEALAARRQADLALQEAAAAERAATLRSLVVGAAGLVAIALWVLAKLHGAKLKALVGSIIPTLDTAYESAAEDVRRALDEKIFNPLSSSMDRSTKALVHQIRAKK